MDFNFWWWVVMIGIAVVSGLNKKKRRVKSKPPTSENQDGSPFPDVKSVGEVTTFEELLKEIQQQKKTISSSKTNTDKKEAKQPVEVSPSMTIQPEVVVKKNDEVISEKEVTPPYVPSHGNNYERKITSSLSYKVEDESEDKDEQWASKYSHVIAKRTMRHDFSKALRGNSNLKKAFVLGEILQRKY